MPLIGTRDLASIWAEAWSNIIPHHGQTNINQLITRSETDAMAHNTVGPIRRTTHEAPVVTWEDVQRPRPTNERLPEQARQQYSAVARNKSFYDPTDYLSHNYNQSARDVYNPDPNPVVINRVV